MTGKFIDAEKEGYNIKCPRVISEEHKQKISLALKGKTISEEHKNAIAFVKIGKTFSKEHKDNMSKAWERRRSNANGCKTSKHLNISEEHKKNVSLGKKGKPSGTLGKKFNIGSDHPRAKLTEEQAQYIIDNKGIIIQKDLAKELGVSKTMIGKIYANISWKHLPRTKENTK